MKLCIHKGRNRERLSRSSRMRMKICLGEGDEKSVYGGRKTPF